MRPRPWLGWLIVAVICATPLVLLFTLGPGESLGSFAQVTQMLGEATALVGITAMALTFVLSTRLPFIEDFFGGLDKVYVAHGVLGGSALALVVFHPIFLVVKFIPSNLRLAALYLLPSGFWSVDFGIVALLGLAFLVGITLYSKMKYQKWKFTHEFLGVVFAFSIVHMILVRGRASHDFIFHGYYVFAALVAAVGLGAFAYSLLLKNRVMKEAVYVIQRIERANDTYEITMAPNHKPLRYTAGQFVYVRFYNERLSREAHPFSIASRSDSPTITIVAKSLGDFTSDLHALEVGDKVAIEGPYGRFNLSSRNEADQVWVAGGIGITPFLGMAQDLRHHVRSHRVDLYYSVRRADEYVGLGQLRSLEAENRNFRFFPWTVSERGFIRVDDIAESSGELKGKEFFLCGPPGFKSAIRTGLLESGVRASSIYEEEFSFR